MAGNAKRRYLEKRGRFLRGNGVEEREQERRGRQMAGPDGTGMRPAVSGRAGKPLYAEQRVVPQCF
jgi:hypothetical protein